MDTRILRLTAPRMHGADVAAVQKKVGAVVDGIYGPNTERAVRAFQRGRGLQDDGVVGAKTWAALAEPEPEPEYVLGVDVSHHQKPERIDWDTVAEDHDFAIARAAYGREPDTTFQRHVFGARAAEMTIGAYVFYRQSQPWKRQLDAMVAELEAVEYGEGCILPVVDMEWNKDFDGPLSPAAHNGGGRALVEALAERYGAAMVYLSPGFFQALGRPAWLLEHEWWIADFNGRAEPWCPFKRDWAIWQHTGKGTIDGYRGKAIDLNRARRVPLVT